MEGATPGEQVRQFKEMVRELHANGIEVILDVVFNHTSEGNEHGPTFSFKGLENKVIILTDVVLAEPQFHRHLFYTGMTRANESVRVYCDKR